MFFVRFSLTDNWVGWFQGINVAFRWMENNFSWTALRGMKSCCANEKPNWQTIRHFSNLIEFFIVRSFSELIFIKSITFYHVNSDNYHVFIRNGFHYLISFHTSLVYLATSKDHELVHLKLLSNLTTINCPLSPIITNMRANQQGPNSKYYKDGMIFKSYY